MTDVEKFEMRMWRSQASGAIWHGTFSCCFFGLGSVGIFVWGVASIFIRHNFIFFGITIPAVMLFGILAIQAWVLWQSGAKLRNMLSEIDDD